MPALPWAQRQAADPGRQYVAMASRLPLKRRRSIPGFLRDTLAIRRQLAGVGALVGDALDGELAGKTFGTFSAWQGQASLDGRRAGPSPRPTSTGRSPAGCGR